MSGLESNRERIKRAFEFVESIVGIFCWSHNTFEPAEIPYRICGECFHTFPSADHLIDDFNDMFDDSSQNASLDEISFCPHCIHDF